MNDLDPFQIESLVLEKIESLDINLDIDVLAETEKENFQGIARDINSTLSPDPEDWVHFLNVVFPKRQVAFIIIGLYGIGSSAEKLDDLFGERASGWARELENKTLTDIFSEIIVYWIMDDLSRVGYLEAWAVRGENVWKRRLAASTTVALNRINNNYTNEVLRVVRHLIAIEDETISEVVNETLITAYDKKAVERFLAWWAPRISKDRLNNILEMVDEDIRERIKDLA